VFVVDELTTRLISLT